MPVVALDKTDLRTLTGLPLKLVRERLPMLGCTIERETHDALEVEFFPDRPDLFSVEGAARALRTFLGKERGLRKYAVKPSGARLVADTSVRKVRPAVAAAYLRGVKLGDRTLRSLIRLQEHLHWTIGRNRRRVAIGLHDAAKVEPPFRYTTAEPGFRFRPLDEPAEMALGKILEEHPTGRAFGATLRGRDRLPLILDAKGRVLSFPPIINAELTRVSSATRDLFVEVTGTGEEVGTALTIVATSLAERGARIESVAVEEGKARRTTPDLRPRKAALKAAEASALLGLDLTAAKTAQLLSKMGFGARPRGASVDVEVPAYRVDILHPWDLAEDVAKAWGFDSIEGVLPAAGTGGRDPVEVRKALAREVLVGLGYQEIVGFTLTRREDDFDRLRLPAEGHTPIANPVSREQTQVRTRLLGTLLVLLAANKHRDHPQRLFEVGESLREGRQFPAAAAVSVHGRAAFAEARSLADGFLREMALGISIVPGDHPSFIPGRCGALLAGQRVVGHFGELHPLVLEAFGLELPAVALEVEIPGE
ncbi:MAG: phenylalanine--tRNA ligase subunit beta [Halobacteria archaeon]